MARTYRFDVTVRIGALLGPEDVCDLFKVILNDAKEIHEISGLEQCSFSFDLPADGCSADSFKYFRISARKQKQNSHAVCSYCPNMDF